MKLRSLILLGATLDPANNSSLPIYPIPVLHVGGSLDGLTRVPSLAVEYSQFLNVLENSQNPDDIIKSKPVVVLEGVSHSQFDDYTFVKNDVDPKYNISMETAHALIAQVMGDFITQNVTALKYWISITSPIVTPLIKAFEVELSGWCITTQYAIVEFNKTLSSLLTVYEEVYSNIFSFAGSKAHSEINGNGLIINTSSFGFYPSNPFHLPSSPLSANPLRCKMRSVEKIQEQLGLPINAPSSENCVILNQAAIDFALQIAPDVQKQRFSKYCPQFVLGDDEVYNSGVTWLAANVNVNLNSTYVTVQSPRLKTSNTAPFGLDGAFYCTLISPARVMEFIYIQCLLGTWN